MGYSADLNDALLHSRHSGLQPAGIWMKMRAGIACVVLVQRFAEVDPHQRDHRCRFFNWKLGRSLLSSRELLLLSLGMWATALSKRSVMSTSRRDGRSFAPHRHRCPLGSKSLIRRHFPLFRGDQGGGREPISMAAWSSRCHAARSAHLRCDGILMLSSRLRADPRRS